MRSMLFSLLVVAVSASAAASSETCEVSGSVRDTSGHALAGATVVLDDGLASAQTDATGAYRIAVPPGDHTLKVSAPGHTAAARSLRLSGDIGGIDVVLPGLVRLSESVVVQAIRADDRTPVTKTDLDRTDIERLHYGQEMPFLLKVVPSVTQYSETGNGAGYSYFYLRGIQQTRINMTLDGVPLSEPEDSALYFADFGDLPGALGSIQVQRGVGTSTVGAASYGGSVNFASIDLKDDAELRAEAGAGSFGTHRGTLAGQSGRLGGGVALYGRASFQETDGFRDRSGVSQHTFFLGGSRQGDRSFLKVFGFSGRERTQLAFLATEKDVLEGDLRSNALAPEEKDRFGQDFLQAQYTRLLGSSSSLSAQAYYNGAGGWYRLWDDPARTALREYGLDWRLIGAQLAFHTSRERLTFTYGAHVNDFHSNHTRDVVGGPRDYSNSGFKNEANTFAKLGYDLGRWRLYADAQLRYARFRYRGAFDLGPVSWTFFNPKLGARYEITPRLAVYGSLGRAMREPARSDMLSGEDDASIPYDLTAVRPERVVDAEAGAEYRSPRLTVRANLYAMEFRNEIALTGELSEIGLPLRRNVPRSHRRGFELELTWQPWTRLRLTSTANLSRNRIAEWTQFYDVYDAEGSYVDSVSRVHRDVSPLLTPTLVLNQGVEWTPSAALGLGLRGRYVSKAYLDNTNQEALTTPSFFSLEASASLGLSRWIKAGEPRIRVQVNNLLDNRRIWPSGYSYLSYTRDASGALTLAGIPYYYPQATRSVLVNLDLKL